MLFELFAVRKEVEDDRSIADEALLRRGGAAKEWSVKEVLADEEEDDDGRGSMRGCGGEEMHSALMLLWLVRPACACAGAGSSPPWSGEIAGEKPPAAEGVWLPDFGVSSLPPDSSVSVDVGRSTSPCLSSLDSCTLGAIWGHTSISVFTNAVAVAMLLLSPACLPIKQGTMHKAKVPELWKVTARFWMMARKSGSRSCKNFCVTNGRDWKTETL